MGSSVSYAGSESVSLWSGRSSADGGLSITPAGIGSPGPFALRHRTRSYTSVFGTSLMGANPPAMSPYRVAYPTACSLFFPGGGAHEGGGVGGGWGGRC